MNNPKVSVVIPCFNAEDYIAEAIESVLTQTFRDFELIVIDDNSSDNSLKAINKFAILDERICVHQNIQNRGIGYTRAKGVRLAKGQYIAWLDADDIAIPDRLELQSRYLDSNLQVGVVGGYLEFFDSEKILHVRRYFEEDESLRKHIFRQVPVPIPTAMYRAEVFSKAGNFDESLRTCEDLEMLFRAGQHFNFANIPHVMVKYRQVSSSITARNIKKMEIQTIRLRLKYSKVPPYSMSFLDCLYNLVQFLSIWMPYRLRNRLFELIRKK